MAPGRGPGRPSQAGRCRARRWSLRLQRGAAGRGLNAVAAPVVAFDGQLVAALSASGPSFRLSVRRLREVAALVRTAAQDISGRLGHLGRP
ncbi:IclR family transcriptional regulator domain-containing protein [Streptomyces sp. NPDC003233]